MLTNSVAMLSSAFWHFELANKLKYSNIINQKSTWLDVYYYKYKDW